MESNVLAPGARLIRPEDILTLEELAARLKVEENWVYEKTRKRCRNRIPCHKLGKYIRFDWAAVCAWMRTTQAVQ